MIQPKEHSIVLDERRLMDKIDQAIEDLLVLKRNLLGEDNGYEMWRDYEISLPLAITALKKVKQYESTGLSPDVCKNYKLFEDELISKGITFKELLGYIDELKVVKSFEAEDKEYDLNDYCYIIGDVDFCCGSCENCDYYEE